MLATARALAGPRAGLYQGEAFGTFRAALAGREPDRPERLADDYFAAADPEELLYPEIEALWAPIANDDDWGPFNAKLERLDRARDALSMRP